MKKAKEILDDVCVGYNDYFSAFNDHRDNSVAFREIIFKAMRLYSQQFIDAANEIIGPACDVLDENYDEEYENWHNIQTINENEKV